MPTAAEEAWEQLCSVVQESLLEEDLVLMSLPNLRALLNHHGFTPLTAARAEVQWQVLQSTHSSVKKKDYEESIKSGSPRRGSLSTAENNSVRMPSVAATPIPPQETEDPECPPSAQPDESQPPVPPSVQKLKQPRTDSPSRASPRRELGSKEGVPALKSLRPLDRSSPARSSFQYPVMHDRAFEVPKVMKGPHMSRRTPLSPRSALVRDDESVRTSSRLLSPRGQASGSNPNEVGYNVNPKVSSLRPMSSMAAAASDPNTTSLEKQAQPPLGIRMSYHGIESHDGPLGTGPESPRKPLVKYTTTDRIAAASNPNDVSFNQSPTRARGKVSGTAAPPSSANLHGGNPNPSMMSASDMNFLPRKGKSDKGATTEEIVPSFVPTTGPPELGVFPGTHSWENAPTAQVLQRKSINPTNIPPAGRSDPNEINQSLSLKFIGGKAQVRGPTEQGVSDSLNGVISVPPPPTSCSGATCDPNTLTASLLAHSKVSQKGLPGSPRNTWSGPANVEGAASTKTGRRVMSPQVRQLSDVSHNFYSARKAEHLVKRPSSRVNSPRRDYTPRYVPSG